MLGPMASQPRPAAGTPDPALARRVIVGLSLFLVGVVLNALLVQFRLPPLGLLVAAVGFVAMAARGGGPHVPTKPEQFRLMARAAQWPETPVTYLLTALLGLGLAGAAVLLYQLALQ